jgi:hypothetical protein
VWLVGFSMTALALTGNLVRVVAVSTFALLFYYGVANLCAARLTVEARRYPRFVPVASATTCAGLMGVILVTTPSTWAIGTAALAAGGIFYAARRRQRRDGLEGPGGGASPTRASGIESLSDGRPRPPADLCLLRVVRTPPGRVVVGKRDRGSGDPPPRRSTGVGGSRGRRGDDLAARCLASSLHPQNRSRPEPTGMRYCPPRDSNRDNVRHGRLLASRDAGPRSGVHSPRGGGTDAPRALLPRESRPSPHHASWCVVSDLSTSARRRRRRAPRVECVQAARVSPSHRPAGARGGPGHRQPPRALSSRLLQDVAG